MEAPLPKSSGDSGALFLRALVIATGQLISTKVKVKVKCSGDLRTPAYP